MLELNKIYNMDCFEGLKQIENSSIDLIITDPPYNTTNLDWDEDICLFCLWKQLKRIIKEDGIIIFTSSQPFTTKLIQSNLSWFKYSWIWDKGLSGNIFLSEYQPMKIHEEIIIFSKNKPKFFPILTSQKIRKSRNNGMNNYAFGDFEKFEGDFKDTLNPKSILYFPNTYRKNIIHPTQKPVNLFRYLIKTYSKNDNIVLDPFMGSGTTAKACKELGRNFIGFEINPEYCKIAEERLKQEVLRGTF